MEGHSKNRVEERMSKMSWRGFHGGPVAKNPPSNARHTGLIPELREPLMWRLGSQVSMRIARGSASLL